MNEQELYYKIPQIVAHHKEITKNDILIYGRLCLFPDGLKTSYKRFSEMLGIPESAIKRAIPKFKRLGFVEVGGNDIFIIKKISIGSKNATEFDDQSQICDRPVAEMQLNELQICDQDGSKNATPNIIYNTTLNNTDNNIHNIYQNNLVCESDSKLDPKTKIIRRYHSDETIKTNVCIEVTFEQALKLKTKFSKRELAYWTDSRIEWLMVNPKKAKDKTRNDYLAILKWQRSKVEQGFVWDDEVMPKEGYYKSYEIENCLRNAERLIQERNRQG